MTRCILRLLVTAGRDILRAVKQRPPYLARVIAQPGDAAVFTSADVRDAFAALGGEREGWSNAFPPRFLFGLPRYKPGTAERQAMPLLVCVADRDLEASPAFAVEIAERPRGRRALLPRWARRHLPRALRVPVRTSTFHVTHLSRSRLALATLVGRVSSLYHDKYLVYTTSGTTGDPAVLGQDRHTLNLYLASRVRMYPAVLDRDTLARVARGSGRSAALLATGGQYGGVVLWKWARRRHSFGRNLAVFSVGAPLAETVAGLNRLQPVIIYGCGSAIAQLAKEAVAGRSAIDPALIFSIWHRVTYDCRDPD